jgi:hypothetical protein
MGMGHREHQERRFRRLPKRCEHADRVLFTPSRSQKEEMTTMSRYMRAVLVGIVALAAVFAAGSVASARIIVVDGGGLTSPITANFPNNGSISLTVGGTTSNCPLRLIGNIIQKTTLPNGQISIGQINSANPNPILGGQPCSANTVTLAGFPWLISTPAVLPPGGAIDITVLGVVAQVGPCTFTGNVSARINASTGSGSTVTGLGGTLAGGPCGNATVGGTGGIITPGLTLVM